MTASIAKQLADFATSSSYDQLPADVVSESKKILLDSIGCAIAAVDETKGRIGIEYAGILGGSDDSATIFGSPVRSSVFGAGFANGELINALDFDAVLPPGHVSPYVLPGLLAYAETDSASGKDLLLGVAISHEMSNRVGKGMDYIRDVKDGVVNMPAVLGYTSTIFGATAAVTRLRGASPDVTAHAIAIAASISPVNSQRSWTEHTPISTIKYTMAGPIVQAALTAAHMAALGHRGDPAVLDDPEFGYPRFIGTVRWAPERIVEALGDVWHFQRENSFKHYPHCRALHGMLDLLTDILDQNHIEANEIDAIRAWGEGHVKRPCWVNNTISDAIDVQFSMAHGLAVGAQRLPASKVWQAKETIYAPQVLDLMSKVTYEVHPKWVTAVVTDPAARPSRVEVDARGQTFSADLWYPKGTPGAVGGSGMSDDQLVAKFMLNAEGVLPRDVAEKAVAAIMSLEAVGDVSPVLRSLGVR